MADTQPPPPPWMMQQAPGSSMGHWGQPPGGSMGHWGQQQQPPIWSLQSKPRQMSSFSLATKTSRPGIGEVTGPVAIANRYSSLASRSEKASVDKKSLQNTIFEKIVWKAPVDRQERKPKGDLSKADEYLFRGKTFSLDNFLKMQGRDVKGSGNHKVCLGRSPASRLMREEEP